MKPLSVFILYFLFSAGFIYGQRTKELKLSFDKSDFLLEELGGQLSISSARHPIQYGADTSEPGLPFVIVHFLIGADEDYSGVEVSYTEALLYRDIFVKNNPTYKVRGSKEASDPVKHTTSYSRALYPVENVRYSGTHLVDGYKYITFLVSPFKYQAQRRQLDLLSDISLKIQLSPSKKSPQKAGRAMRDIVQRIVVNGDEMQALYEKPIVNYRNTFSRDIRSGNDPFDYLIITRDSLKDAFQKLADWKTRKGVPTKVITMEHIDTIQDYWQVNFFGQAHTPLGIKNAIKDYYDNHNIKYVLLGGDNNIVFSEKCQLNYNDKTPNYKKTSVCDLFFACLNPPVNWNRDGDNYIAEYEDSADCHPVIAVSRLSVCSNADAEMQINRIINYERNPNLEAWNDSILMMGCALDTNFLDMNLTDVVYKGAKISDSLGYFGAGGRFLFYDKRTSHPNDSNYNVTVAHFKERLARGYSFIHIDTHGSADILRLEPPEYFYNNNASDYVNPGYSMIVTSACATNDFEADCLSEAFMRNPNGGIIAYWGGSNDVIGPQDEEYPGWLPYLINEKLLGSADKINIQIYNHLIKEYENHLGDAINQARLTYIVPGSGNIPYSDSFRWNLFSLNLLGDPEMPIYTKAPMEFDGLDINLINDNLLYFGFNTYNQEFSYFDICIMSLEDNGVSYYSIIHHVADGTTLDLPPGHDYSICATQPGFKPFIVNIYRRGFVQNDTIANESIVWSNQAMIGRDVTTAKPQGPVVVEKDKMTIKATNGVTIKNSFTLKKGASLVIDPTIQYIIHDPVEQ